MAFKFELGEYVETAHFSGQIIARSEYLDREPEYELKVTIRSLHFSCIWVAERSIISKEKSLSHY